MIQADLHKVIEFIYSWAVFHFSDDYPGTPPGRIHLGWQRMEYWNWVVRPPVVILKPT